MGLFDKLFSKKEKIGACSDKSRARIKVLGGGCQSCHDLEANTRKALEELGREEDIKLVTDFAEIAKYGVMSTPALVVDEKVLSFGKILSKDEVKQVLEERLG